MYIRPSEIRYSQDSIASYFSYGSHNGQPIGETLDEILSGRCTDEDIPKMTVTFRNGHWYTGDNRRLWVFRKAEELGIIDYDIEVVEGWVNPNKFTTENQGASIRVRGNPGGKAWRKRRPPKRIIKCDPPPKVIEPPRSIAPKRDIPISPQKGVHVVMEWEKYNNYSGDTTIHSKNLLPSVVNYDNFSLILDESSMEARDTPVIAGGSYITDTQSISRNDYRVSRNVMTSYPERDGDRDSTVNVNPSSEATTTNRTRSTVLDMVTEDPVSQRRTRCRCIAGVVFITFLLFLAIILILVFVIRGSF